MFEWTLLFLLLAVALLVYAVRLRTERQGLRHELGRVLRAADGRADAQEMELRWLVALCGSAEEAMLVTGPRKEMRYMNPAAERMFGPLLAGMGAIRQLRDHRLERLLDRVLAGEEGLTEYLESLERSVLAQAHSWHNTAGALGGAVLLVRDVSEHARLVRARRDMAVNLSHELRTPLTSVKLLSETLQNGALADPSLAREMVARIVTENDALIRLLEDLTTLTGIESGRTPLRLEQLNLRTLVEARLRRLAPQQAEAGLHFALDGPPAACTWLDPERFGQVLTNLLDNAMKFSPPGGTIHITLAQDEAATTLVVRDEGSGILPHELPRIFERFYKSDRARTRSASSGTGLGLAIARHLVEAHGGTLAAANHPQHGAVFTVTLPNE